MKGIVLAGGAGTRLYPLTLATCKQLLPVYNKPMIYYPLSVLMQAGIKEILLISTPHDRAQFERLFGNGSRFGLSITYEEQKIPKGIAEAFLIGEKFIGKERTALILGDNIFYGDMLPDLLRKAVVRKEGATLFGYRVKDPERYGVAEIDASGKCLSIMEKPSAPKSNVAVTGLYFFDEKAVSFAKTLSPSARGELEITDLNQMYVQRGEANLEVMGPGCAWLDAGTFDSLMLASHFVQVIEERQGRYIAALEEIAFLQGWISVSDLVLLSQNVGSSAYGRYLYEVAEQSRKK
jgi:glucose-1-phosphate thymidylyltransferase